MMAVPLISIAAVETANAGSVRGRIIDEEGILPGAVVYIDDKAACVVSDVDGFYSISGLKPGEHTFTTSYVGFSSRTEVVNVTPGNTLNHDIRMSATATDLDEVIVAGVFTGQQRAINIRKNNLNISNIVSADQVGRFPDQNIGDALKRITGI